MFGIRFLRCSTFRDGRRTARPVSKHLVSSCFRAPRDCTYSDWQMVSVLTCISGQSGNSTFSRPAICSGEYFLARSASTLPRSSRF
jgi:hypothetical protein